MGSFETLSDVKIANKKIGHCYFSQKTNQFFGTRFESKLLKGEFFITSESNGSDKRKFSIRKTDSKGIINTIGPYYSYNSKKEALKALEEHLECIS